jgi:RHS repeat-associated protein
LLRQGSVIENVLDIGYEGSVIPFEVRRTYRTIANPEFGGGTSLGNRWFDASADIRLLTNANLVSDDGHGTIDSGDDLFLRMSALETVVLKKKAGTNEYTAPPDWDLIVTNDTGSESSHEFTVWDRESEKAFVFWNFDEEVETWKRGHLKKYTIGSGHFSGECSGALECGTEMVWSQPPGSKSSGSIAAISPTLGGAGGTVGSISYARANIAGVDRTTSVTIWSGSPNTSTILQRVEYTYKTSTDSRPGDLGSPGDLILVTVSKKDSGSSYSYRYTHYRYYSSDTHGLPGIMKAVYEHDALQQMIADSSNLTPTTILTKADDFEVSSGGRKLSQYASRAFQYSYNTSTNVDTSNVDTKWSADENLHTKYAGTSAQQWDEAHEMRVKVEDLYGASCTMCSVPTKGRMTKEYYFVGLKQGYDHFNDLFSVWTTASRANHVNEVTLIVVEDTISYTDSGTATPLYRTIYGLNDFGRKLREVHIENPMASDGNLRCWCQAWIYATYDLNGDGDALDAGDKPNLKHRLVEYRPPSVYSVTTAAKLRAFLDPFDDDDTNMPGTLGTGKDNGSDLWSAETGASIFSGTGPITVYEYNDNGRLTGTRIKEGTGGDAYYISAFDWGDGSSGHPKDRIEYERTYPVATTNRSDSTRITTSYTYTYWCDNDMFVKKRTTTFQAVTAAQNGSNTPIVTEEYFDYYGRLRWFKDGEGYVNYYSYTATAPGVAFVAIDVDPTSLPASAADNPTKWARPIDGGANDNKPASRAWNSESLPTALALVTTQEFDQLGRPVVRTDPATPQNSNGARHYTVYQAKTNGVTRVIQVPYSGSVTAPIEVNEYDTHGRISLSYTLPPNYTMSGGSTPTGLAADPDTDDYLGLTRYLYDANGGRLTEAQRFHRIDHAESLADQDRFEDFFGTRFIYTIDGQRGATIQDVASGRYQVSVSLFDTLDRVIETRNGVATAVPTNYGDLDNSPPGTPSNFLGYATTASTEYDYGGIGDSQVTSSRSYYGTGTSYIETIYKRTYRGHLRGMDQKNGTSSFGPYQVQDIDWMGRTIASATYASAPSTWPSGYANYVHDPTENDNAGGPMSSGHNETTITKYDVLGRIYETLVFPGTQSENRFEENNYYDRNGQLVASGHKHAAHREFAHDGAGRQYQVRTVKAISSTLYSDGRFNYVAPVPHPSFASMSGGDGGVIELSHTGFDKAGNEIEEHSVESNHDDTNGFSLTAGEPTGGVRTTNHSYYDAADRITTGVFYGAADHDDGAVGWAAYDLPTRDTGTATTFTSDANRLVTQYSYDADSGRLTVVADPAGIKTKTFYDDDGRRVFVAENFVDFVPSTLSPPGSGLADASDKSKDRVTRWEYNGLGQITELVAYNSDGTNHNPETTRYFYEDRFDASLATNTIYPDSTETSPVDDDDPPPFDQVRVVYNLDGTPATRTDQRGVVRTFSYNASRQQTRDGVTTIPGSVDGSIKAIGQTYDNLGRREKITSYPEADGTGTPLNEIKYEYDSTGRVYRIYQEHAGAETTSSHYVEFGYADEVDTSGVYENGLRVETVLYPVASIAKVDTNYGNSASVSDLLQRAANQTLWGGNSLNGNASHKTHYDYNGPSRLVGLWTESSNTNLKREMFSSSGNYDRFNRFGDAVKFQWKDRSSGNVLDEIDYGYDPNGNRLMRNVRVDQVNGSYVDERDQDYDYDGLHRLKDADQGDASDSTGLVADPLFEQRWALDQLGNWSEFKQDNDGDGSFTGAADLDQDRLHNSVNEIDDDDNHANTPASTITAASGQRNWADPTHDAAGNMTSAPGLLGDAYNLPLLKYDAWNRLVRVDLGPLNPYATFEYDGLGQRIVQVNNGIPNYGTFDYYYNDNWQLLTEVKDGSVEAIYHWHPHYVDALGVRMRSSDTHFFLQDANFNVTAAVKDDGNSVVERYGYTPYGEPMILDADFTADSVNDDGYSDIDNRHLYTGREFDWDSGLQLNRHRYYASHLGRWIGRDPIEYDGGTSNLYEYASSGVPNGHDPYGLRNPTLRPSPGVRPGVRPQAPGQRPGWPGYPGPDWPPGEQWPAGFPTNVPYPSESCWNPCENAFSSDPWVEMRCRIHYWRSKRLPERRPSGCEAIPAFQRCLADQQRLLQQCLESHPFDAICGISYAPENCYAEFCKQTIGKNDCYCICIKGPGQGPVPMGRMSRRDCKKNEIFRAYAKCWCKGDPDPYPPGYPPGRN